jgi:hypothetical protein
MEKRVVVVGSSGGVVDVGESKACPDRRGGSCVDGGDGGGQGMAPGKRGRARVIWARGGMPSLTWETVASPWA